jgi:hypothetical protein
MIAKSGHIRQHSEHRVHFSGAARTGAPSGPGRIASRGQITEHMPHLLHHPGKKMIFPVRWGAAAGALGEEIIPALITLSAGGLLGFVFLGMQ